MSADAPSPGGETSSQETPPDDAPSDDGIVRHLSLEEFTPSGTLAVTGLYFLLLLALYALMYFVEFAGRPSIIE